MELHGAHSLHEAKIHNGPPTAQKTKAYSPYICFLSPYTERRSASLISKPRLHNEFTHYIQRAESRLYWGECRDRPVRLLPRHKMHAKLEKCMNVPNYHILRRIRNCS
jgi:hypothetical protein